MFQEFDETSKNCLENVKLKDIENGSYINSKYLMKYTSGDVQSGNIISIQWKSLILFVE